MSAPGIVREGQEPLRGSGARLAPAGQGGYTVVEVLVAAVLMSFVLVGLAMLYSEGQTFVVAEGDDRVAIVLARKKIEALRDLGYGCIPPADTPGTLHVPQPAEPKCPGDAGVPDTVEALAARKYHEDQADDCDLADPGDPAPCPPGGRARFESRRTTVQCVDPVTLAPQTPCPSSPAGKKITVEVYPVLSRARPVRAEAFLALR